MAIGNIMGGPFSEWVTNQIKVRQQSLGQGSGLDTPNLLYQQSKTPWLRLASSVDLDPVEGGGIDILKRLGGLDGINVNEITGPGAARNFILQGGAISLEGKNDFKQNSGLNLTDKTFNGAYGWGGVSNRGLVPMPGITGASVKFLNNGALTKTEINIKCYSRNQFALVDALYMRPGYTLLLEFGWSTYLDNDGKLQTYNNFYSPALSYLFNPNFQTSNQHLLVKKILRERESRFGNYEGVYGKITNFKWNFNPDGSYDCIVNLTGLGEVIESMNVNISIGTNEGIKSKLKKGKDSKDEKEEESDEIPLIANALKTTLNEILFAIYQDATTPPTPPPPKPKSAGRRLFDLLTPFDEIAAVAQMAGKAISYVYKKVTNNDQEDIFKDYSIDDFPYISPTGELELQTITVPKGVMVLGGTDTDDDDNESPQVYITFGAFIALLQKNIILKTEDTKCPYLYFNMNFLNLNEDKNYIKRIPGQFSGNPLVCLIPYTGHNITKESFLGDTNEPIRDSDIEFDQLPTTFTNTSITENGADWEAYTYLGRLSCVYLNVNYLAKVLDSTPSNEDDVKPLLDYLRSIIKDMTSSLGGINDIIVKPSQDGTKIEFIENIPQRFDPDPPEKSLGEMCRFNTFGFTNGVGGSIVRNIGIDGSISSNFSSMIAIGAQSNGNQPGTNATSFSNYNNGLIDRVIPTKGYSDDDDEDQIEGDTDGDGRVDYKERKALRKKKKNELKEILAQATNINKSLKKIIKGGFWDWEGGGVFGDVYRDRQWVNEDLELLTTLNTQYVNLIDGVLSQPKGSGGVGQLNAPFFLPFNFNMEIDGIGGIGLMQKFKIDEKILPPVYDKDSVEIIVRGVDHQINETAWLTKLDTQSTPTSEKEPANQTNPLSDSTSSSPTSGTNSNTAQQVFPPNVQPPGDELLRMRITRIMDDGTQTLGIMDVLAEDEQTVLYSLATSELPWKGNQNNISCIPIDNYLVKSHVRKINEKCFWLIGNGGGDYKFNRLVGNGYTRGAVLIHMFPQAPGWALGCIGPGIKFNNQSNQKGRQKGTGQHYLEPSKAQSWQAMDKIVSTLFSVGSFKLKIVNATTPLPSTFNSQVKSRAAGKNLLPNPFNA